MSNDESTLSKWEESNKVSEDKDLKELEQNAFRESIEDGLEIIMAGILILFVSFMLLDLVFAIVFVSVMILRNRILEGFRKMFTYKRIGQVQLHKGTYADVQKAGLILFLVTVASIAPVLFLLSSIHPQLIILAKWYPAIFGLLFLGPSYYISSKSGNSKYYLFTLGAMILGFFFSLIEFSVILQGWFFYILSLGGIMVVVGCIGFARFLRKYPIIELQEADDSD